MARPAPSDSSQDPRFTVERYLALFDEGVLDRDDRVELLEPGRESDYEKAHPTGALLLVEVAQWSLPQDRVTKRGIYAAAGVSEYWIVNLRDDRVEVLRAPDRKARLYRETSIARRGARITLAALPDASVALDELLPGR